MATFSVIVLMKESAAVIHRFAAYYHRIGAAEILLYLDGGTDAELHAGLDHELLETCRVTLLPCDDAFWAATPDGTRPPDIQDRQRVVYLQGHGRCTTDWALICDADEFVIPRRPVSDFLNAMPADVISVAIAPVEAVWGPGEDIDEAFGSTWFRRPKLPKTVFEKVIQPDLVWIYGPFGLLLRSGMLSHVIGKHFVRVDAAFDVIDLHFARRKGARVTHRAIDVDPALGDVELAHFDAISFERWHAKSLRRVVGDTAQAMRRRGRRRRAQLYIFDILRRFGIGALRWYYRQLFALTRRQARLLEKRGLVFQMNLFKIDRDGRPSI